LKKIIAIIFLKYYVSKISTPGRGDFGGVGAGMRDRIRLSARRGDRQFFELQLAFIPKKNAATARSEFLPALTTNG
jgi:hypothetical protein